MSDMRGVALWYCARPVWVRLAVAAGLGAAAATGQAPWNLWPLALLAWAGLFGVFRAAQTLRCAAISGLAMGVGYFAIALSWIVEPFLVDVASHGWMAPFALILMSFGFALFWAGAQAIARSLGGNVWAWAAMLTLAEALRGWLWTGFPWAQPGHIWISTPLLRWAAFGGALPLTFLTLIIGAALWHVAQGRWRGGVLGLAAPLALLIGALWLPDAPMPGAEAPIVRLVQPNVPQNEKWDPARTQLYFDRQLALTAAGTPPDLIVWPETALPVLLNYADDALEEIVKAARGAPMVLGVQRAEGPRYFNSLLFLDRDGRQAALYDKHHLVPFGEYVPFGDTMARFGIRGLAQQSGFGYSAGPGAQLIDMGALGQGLPLICYEGVFARDVAAAPGRADFLLMITNDAWFGELSGPYQHLAQARLRSAEQGLAMIRAANTGVSAMIDAAGNVVAQIPLGETGYLDVPLPPAFAPTLYAKTGDLPVILLLVIAALSASFYHRRILRVVRE